MKKVISMLLVMVMAIGIFTACGNTPTPTPTEDTTPVVADPANPLEVLENTFAKYEESQKFPMAGGAGENMNWEGPAAIDMAANGADLSYIVYVPEAEIANITEAATVQHAMNANTFTAAVLRVKEGTDARAFALTLRDAIQSTQWLCGFPEKVIGMTIGEDYVVVAFGHDNTEAPLISTFCTKVLEAYPEALTVYTENIG